MIDMQAALAKKYSILQQGADTDTFKAHSEDQRGWDSNSIERANVNGMNGLRAAQSKGILSESAHRDAMSPLWQQSATLENTGLGLKNTGLGLQNQSSALGLEQKQAFMPAWKKFAEDPDSVNKMLNPSYGLRTGTARVVDKSGKGDPKKDTVPAVLAEGEAVLNAGAAETLGREAIDALNQEGMKRMGLRGKPEAVVKDGVVHASTGYRDGLEGDLARAEGEKWWRKMNPELAAAADNVSGAGAAQKTGLPARAGTAVGAALNNPWGTTKALAKKVVVPAVAAYGAATDDFSYKADAGEGGFSSGLKNALLQAGNVGTRALDLVSTDLINLPGALAGKEDVIEPFNNIYRKNMVDAGVATQGSTKQAPTTQAKEMSVAEAKALARETDKAVDGKQVPLPAGYESPEARAAKEATTRKNTGLRDQHAFAILSNLVGASGASEIMKDVLNRRELDARDVISQREQGVELAKVGASKSAKQAESLNDTIKRASLVLGEGSEGALLNSLHQRKQTAMADAIAAGKPELAKQIQDSEMDEDFVMDTANQMKLRASGADNSAAGRAGLWGTVGTVLGGVGGMAAGALTKKPKLIRAGWGALTGAAGLGGAGYATGSHGVDEYTDLNRIAALKRDEEAQALTGEGISIPYGFVDPPQQVLTGVRR